LLYSIKDANPKAAADDTVMISIVMFFDCRLYGGKNDILLQQTKYSIDLTPFFSSLAGQPKTNS